MRTGAETIETTTTIACVARAHFEPIMLIRPDQRDLSPILPTGSDGCVYNSAPVHLKVQIVCYERVQTGLSITVPMVGRLFQKQDGGTP